MRTKRILICSLMLVIKPSRHCDPNPSKNLAVGKAASADEDLHGTCCALNSCSLATAAVGNADTRRVNLARPSLAAQLAHDFDDLSGAGGTEGMSLAEQSPAGVDRESPVDMCLSASDCEQVGTLFEQAEPLDPQGLGNAEAVVHFGEVNILRPDPGDFISSIGRFAGQRFEGHRGGL